MAKLFLLIAVFLSGIAALLYFVPRLRILNIVNDETPESAMRINRYVVPRLLVPVGLSAGCACLVALRPELAVPLLLSRTRPPLDLGDTSVSMALRVNKCWLDGQ